MLISKWAPRGPWCESKIVLLYNNHIIDNNSIIYYDVIKWKHFPRYWHLCGEFTGPGEFPSQRPMTRSFDVFFDQRLNERLSKQSCGWWFETLSSPLWRHSNVYRSIISGMWFLCLPPIFSKLTHWHKHINRILLENIVIQFVITFCAKLSVITICFKAERVITILLTAIILVNIIIFL